MTKRLSNSAALVGLSLEEDDNEPLDSMDALGNACNDNVARPLKGGRSKGRRSSFGGSIGALGKSPPKASEQARIAEMYKTVIKLSSENKINEKNSWSLDLIDHMGKLIKEESSTNRGVNFQKASCTLEASVKIYSHRVDDTHTSSHRILESLSRNGNNIDEGDEEEDAGDTFDEDGNPIPKKKIAKVGSKSNSNRLNIAETIEKNLSNINTLTLDKAQAVDPMFHRLSKAFDEGGVKGLLMANMRVSTSACTLAFDCGSTSKIIGGATENTNNANNASNGGKTPEEGEEGRSEDKSVNDCDQSILDKSMGQIVTKVPFGGMFQDNALPAVVVDESVVDITDIITKCGFSLDDIAGMAICPSLDTYRNALDIKDSAAGLFDQSQFNVYFPSSSKLTLAAAPVIANPNPNHLRTMNPDIIDDDCDCDVGGGVFGNDDYDDDNDDNAYASSQSDGNGWPSTPLKGAATPVGTPGKVGTPGTGRRMSFGNTKIHWETVFDDNSNATHGIDSNGNPTHAKTVSLNDGIISHNEYTFFDMDLLCKSNAWAGVKHWKIASRSQARMAAQGEATPADSTNGASPMVEGEDPTNATANASNDTSDKNKEVAKREKYVIDFSADSYLSEALFDAPKTKSTTMMTKAAIDKSTNLSNELFLPADAKLQAKDLTRLYLCNQMLLPPPEMQRMLLAAPNKSWRFKRNFLGVPSSSSAYAGDLMWGEAEHVARGQGSAFAAPAAFDDMHGDDDHEDGGYTYNDDNDDYSPDTESALTNNGIEGDNNDGLQINSNGLLQATRKVDKVQIGYCTIAKRVNVRKLKTDIWSHIDSNVKEHCDKKEKVVDLENVVPGNKMDYLSGESDSSSTFKKTSAIQTEKLSFQELVKDIGDNQNQREVTLPFYFICLLHLANEKTLKIEGNMDMNDLVISKDI